MIFKNRKLVSSQPLDTLPIGTIQATILSIAPNGYLLLQGQQERIARYPELAALCGSKFNNGSTPDIGYFYLPDLRGRTIVGLNSGDVEFNAMGKLFGSKTHTLTIAQLASHTHSQNAHSHPRYPDISGLVDYRAGATQGGGASGSDGWGQLGGTARVGTYTGNATATNNNSGDGAAHNIIQPSITLNYMVKAESIMSNEQSNATLPIGSILINSNNANPGEYLNFGTWVRKRTFYGGELIGYMSVYNNASGSTVLASGTSYAFSDNAIPSKVYYGTSYVPGVITGTGGAVSIQTKGIVGYVEASCSISGLSVNNGGGLWWAGNSNALPSGIRLISGDGIIDGGTTGNLYTGSTNTYAYQVETTNDVQFYVNPLFRPYNANFTPTSGGVRCQLVVRAYAKYEESYVWERIA